MTDIPKLDLNSMNITEERLLRLKEILPEVFTEGSKIDFEKLKLALGENIDTARERYGMQWNGKADCFKLIQQPCIATLIPDRNESVDFDDTENIFIEGDNLEVLKLLQKSYFGKIKMIYIDPPYNTGNDFIYPDNFTDNLRNYLEMTGQIDGEGRKYSTNPESDGRYHSKWLNMMYPRLYLARNLLREDGVIFISIDDNEVDNLKKICNEVFGEENFVDTIIWQKKYSPQNDARWFSDMHDYIVLYAKDKNIWRPLLLDRTDEMNARYSNPDNDLRGNWKSSDLLVKTYSKDYDYPITTPSGRIVNPPSGRCWRTSKENFQNMITDNRIWFGEKGDNVPSIKRFLSEVKDGLTPMTLWLRNEVGDNQEAAKEIKDLFEGNVFFDTPKPTRLIKRMLSISSESNDFILDFFAGSCTTAHAVMELNKEDGGNRKYICVQLPEPTDENSEANKAGYKSIADIGKERIRRVIKKIEEEITGSKEQSRLFPTGNDTNKLDLGFKVFKLQPSNFRLWDGKVKEEDLEKQIEMHVDHINPKSTDEDILFEILLKSGFPLNTKIEKLTVEGKTVYGIEGVTMLICLEKELTEKIIKSIGEIKPKRVVFLDEGFKGNDQLKTNAVQIMKTKGVESFKVV